MDLLEMYLKSWASKNNILVNIEVFYNAESFEINWSMNKKHNILLLDIEMPGKNVVELAKHIRRLDDRFIIVYISEMKEQLYISVANSVGGEIQKINLEYISTKLGMNHGFGLKRVDSIVNLKSLY